MTTATEPAPQTRRRRILDAAADAFLDHGFLGVSMDAISERAAVSKQTVYAHFRSKEALFVEVIGAMTGGAARALGEDEPSAAIDVAGRSVEQFLVETGAAQLRVVLTPRLMRLRRLVIGEAGRFPELGRALHQGGPQQSIDRYARAFAHFQTLGALEMADPETAAQAFNWLLMGKPLHDVMFLGDAAAPSAADIDAHVQAVVRLFLAAHRRAGDGAETPHGSRVKNR